jgi:hypothetical protein
MKVKINQSVIEDVINSTGKPEELNKILFKDFVEFEGNPEEIQKMVEESICQFGQGKDSLSLIGFINGILPALTNKVLVQYIDDDGKFLGYRVEDKWW